MQHAARAPATRLLDRDLPASFLVDHLDQDAPPRERLAIDRRDRRHPASPI